MLSISVVSDIWRYKMLIERKIFVSSTIYDLRDERVEIKRYLDNVSIPNVKLTPIMSEYPNTFRFTEEDFTINHTYDTCLNNISRCDYVLLIINKRYNLIIENNINRSITHMEYLEARNLQKPIICFINEETYSAYKKFKKSEPQEYIVEQAEHLFDFVDEIYNAKVGNWVFRYKGTSDLIKQIDEMMITFDRSTFVDEYPPDGKKYKNHSEIIKKWTIQNSGNVVWKNRVMKCTDYTSYFYPEIMEIHMPNVFPGETYTLEVKYHIKAEGRYESVWKMFDEHGQLSYPKLKGLWIEVKIEK